MISPVDGSWHCKSSSWESGTCWKVTCTQHELLLWFPRLRGSYGIIITSLDYWIRNQPSEKLFPQWAHVLTVFSPLLCSFEETVGYFGIKPKPGEKEISPNYVFTVWYEFCSDFKTIWKRESKSISKER